MSNTGAAFSRTVKKLIGLMLGLVATAAIIGFFSKGMEFTLALLYGGAITVSSALFFAWRLRIATRPADNTGQQSASAAAGGVNAAVLFQGILLRLVMIIVFLALGMRWLKLDPLGLVTGFVIPLAAYWFVTDSYGVTRRK